MYICVTMYIARGNGGDEYFLNTSMVCIFAANLMQLSNFVCHEWDESYDCW